MHTLANIPASANPENSYLTTTGPAGAEICDVETATAILRYAGTVEDRDWLERSEWDRRNVGDRFE